MTRDSDSDLTFVARDSDSDSTHMTWDSGLGHDTGDSDSDSRFQDSNTTHVNHVLFCS